MISIVIPLYNKEKYVKETLESLKMLSDAEIIIVDNASTDNGPKICKTMASMDSRIRMVKESRKGVSFARNRGIEEARGEWICFLDADDLYRCDTISKIVNECELQQIDTAVFDFEKIDDLNGKTLGKYSMRWDEGVVKKDVNERFLMEAIENMMAYNVSNKIYRTSLIRREGICFSESMNRLEDLSFFLSAASKSKRLGYYRYAAHQYRCNLAEGSLVWKKREEYEYVIESTGVVLSTSFSNAWKEEALALIESRELSEVRLHSDFAYYRTICERIKVMVQTAEINYPRSKRGCLFKGALRWPWIFWIYTRLRRKVAFYMVF